MEWQGNYIALAVGYPVVHPVQDTWSRRTTTTGSDRLLRSWWCESETKLLLTLGTLCTGAAALDGWESNYQVLITFATEADLISLLHRKFTSDEERRTTQQK